MDRERCSGTAAVDLLKFITSLHRNLCMPGIREPYVAGAFYPADKESLLELLEQLARKAASPKLPRRPKILVVPHAGYVYSGLTAMHGYLTLAEFPAPSVALVLGTKHTPYGHDYALADYEYWLTPLGPVKENLGLVDCLSSSFPVDNLAHELEHSIEVQLPFLQYIYGERCPQIVPLVAAEPSPAVAEQAAAAFRKALAGTDWLMIVSTDFTHYEPQEIAEKKDRLALEDVLSLDYYKLYNDIIKYNISICGAAVLLVAVCLARQLGLEGRLLHYSTSGDATGDYSAVVGYAAVAFY
ncbi:MAG: AmmeMemoRadiSam system protein B [bacterium]|nr:AmmeMemoRadiSam system protein B [bacterium]